MRRENFEISPYQVGTKSILPPMEELEVGKPGRENRLFVNTE